MSDKAGFPPEDAGFPMNCILCYKKVSDVNQASSKEYLFYGSI